MRILLVHQNYPAQFKHLGKVLGRNPKHQVVALTLNGRAVDDGVKVVRYTINRATSKEIHPWASDFEAKIIRGEGVVRAARELRNRGFYPELIYAHPGWGETLFLKDVFPTSRLVCFAEFYYRSHGLDVGFDPEFAPADENTICNIRARNAHNLIAFESCDSAIAPTEWQRASYPEFVRQKISVVHDGIDTVLLQPDPNATIRLGDSGPVLRKGDKVITYVARNLEPYRGFHIFMRTLPILQKLQPDANVVIVGGDAISYGKRLEEGVTYRQKMINEVGFMLDLSRIHFVGQLPYPTYQKLLQISAAHIYLTYPFVLSWSMLESMALGAPLIASATPPVTEVVRDRQEGLLFDFFDCEGLAKTVDWVLKNQQQTAEFSKNAREKVMRDYDLHNVCLPRQLHFLGLDE